MDPFSFGNGFRVTVFGSSHGPHVGVEIEGCPEGVPVSESDVQIWLDRRKPGASPLASARKEEDRVIVEGGIEGGKTTGGKIRMIVKNTDAKSKDYEKVKKALEEKQIKIESASLEYVAKEEVVVSEKEKEQAQRLFDALDDNDAVNEIYSNLKN